MCCIGKCEAYEIKFLKILAVYAYLCYSVCKIQLQCVAVLGWSKDPGPTYSAGRLPAISIHFYIHFRRKLEKTEYICR